MRYGGAVLRRVLAMNEPITRPLSPEEEQVLLRIARDSLHDCVTHERKPDLEQYALTPALRASYGVFIALRCAGHLRGRVGSATSHLPLAETVRDYTFQAALHDEDYRPVAPNEVDDIDIEIAVLCPAEESGSPFIAVQKIEEITVGRDGLYLEHAGTQGGALILPQEAKAHHWDAGRFLKALCRKAGAPPRAWELPGASLYRFSAQVFRERHHSDYPHW